MAHNKIETYGAEVDAKLRASLVTKDGIIFNTKYEGTATAGAVKIPVRDGETVVGNYSTTNLGSNGVNYGSTDYITAVVDSDKFINEYIDGYEAESVPANLVADRLESAGFSLANDLDTAGLKTLCYACLGKDHNGTTYASTDVRYNTTGTSVTATNSVFADIVDCMVALDNANVPAENRWLIVTPNAYASLIKSSDFVKQSDLSQKLVETGAVGMISGFVIYKSSKLASIATATGLTGAKAIAGHSLFATRVEEWKVEPRLVDGNSDANVVGGSFVKGRKVYTHEVTKPQALAYIA